MVDNSIAYTVRVGTGTWAVGHEVGRPRTSHAYCSKEGTRGAALALTYALGRTHYNHLRPGQSLYIASGFCSMAAPNCLPEEVAVCLQNARFVCVSSAACLYLQADPNPAPSRDGFQQCAAHLTDELHLPTLNTLLLAPHHHYDNAAVITKDTQLRIKSARLAARARLGLSSSSHPRPFCSFALSLASKSPLWIAC